MNINTITVYCTYPVTPRPDKCCVFFAGQSADRRGDARRRIARERECLRVAAAARHLKHREALQRVDALRLLLVVAVAVPEAAVLAYSTSRQRNIGLGRLSCRQQYVPILNFSFFE